MTNAEDIADYVGHALLYQHMFERKTSPWEMNQWDQDELQSFDVELDKVDRLYNIDYFNDGVSGSSFYLMVRMVYNEKHVFVELNASCDYTGFDCQGGGDIFITINPNLFSKVITRPPDDMERLYQSLAEDGYHIDKQTEHDHTPVAAWHNAPMLKFLCHLAIFDNKDKLQHYQQVLPKVLKDSVHEFIIIRDAIHKYDSDD